MQFALTVVITVGLVVLALGQQQYIHIAVFSTYESSNLALLIALGTFSTWISLHQG